MTECIHAKSILHLMTSKYVSKAGLCFKLVSLLTYELLMNTTIILVEITEQVLLFSLLVQSEKMTKKKPKFGALPTLNMPKKSHDSRKPVPRPSRTIVRDHEDKTDHVYLRHLSAECRSILSADMATDTRPIYRSSVGRVSVDMLF